MPPLTAAQLDLRRTYLGGTDMASLAGLNPEGWAQPIDVWLEKTGQAPPRTSSPKMALGHLLEDTVCDLFEAATGYQLRRPPAERAGAVYVMRHPRLRHLGGNVDRWATATQRTYDLLGTQAPATTVVEAKHSDQPDEWGPQGSDRVPARYRTQLMHYVGLRPWLPGGYLCVLLPHADFRWYWLARDDEAIDMMHRLGTGFWQDNVLALVPPEPDGTEAYGHWLRGRWQADKGLEQVATPEQVLWAAEAADLRRRLAADSRALELVKQKLQDSMGATERLLLPFGQRITYGGYDKRVIDWQGTARHAVGNLLDQDPHHEITADEITAALDELAAKYTTTSYVRGPFTWPKLTDEEAPE